MNRFEAVYRELVPQPEPPPPTPQEEAEAAYREQADLGYALPAPSQPAETWIGRRVLFLQDCVTPALRGWSTAIVGVTPDGTLVVGPALPAIPAAGDTAVML